MKNLGELAMRGRKIWLLLSIVTVAVLLSFAGTARAKAPQESLDMLKQLNMTEKDMGDIDKQLAVPKAWLDGAKKEGELVFLGTLDEPEWKVMQKVFLARYPFLKVKFSRASHEDRANKTVEAFKARRFVSDIITGIGGNFYMFKAAGALADLRGIPQWKAIPAPDFKDVDSGLWVGIHRRHWGWAYNTDLVKRQDLPKTYEEVLTSPVMRNGSLAIGNRPQLWLLALWSVKGEAWTMNFMNKLFSDVKPQKRKEGMNAMTQLLGAGEFAINVPSAGYNVRGHAKLGAPVAWFSPEPLTLATSEMGILANAEHPYAAKILVNWWLSREGQLAQYLAEGCPPSREDMQTDRFLTWPKEMVGKKIAMRSPDDELKIQPILAERFNKLWLGQAAK